jgi:hypothetical protein
MLIGFALVGSGQCNCAAPSRVKNLRHKPISIFLRHLVNRIQKPHLVRDGFRSASAISPHPPLTTVTVTLDIGKREWARGSLPSTSVKPYSIAN